MHDENFMLRTYDNELRRIVPIHFHGRKLAYASSKRPTHTHPYRHYANTGERCSACRWFEVAIYKVTQSNNLRDQPVGGYVLETKGITIVEGEHDRFRVRCYRDPWIIVAKLMKRVDNDVILPVVSRNVLSEASKHDEKLKEAFLLVDNEDHMLLGDLQKHFGSPNIEKSKLKVDGDNKGYVDKEDNTEDSDLEIEYEKYEAAAYEEDLSDTIESIDTKSVDSTTGN
jgi:hypothetical protein